VAINEISTHFVKTFESNALHLVQQKTSKLRRTVTEKRPGPTDKHSFRVIAARGAMTDRANVGAVAGKRTATPYSDTVFNDRVCGSTRKGTADSFSRAEAQRMLEDPQSALLASMTKQVGRTFDDVIIAALFANALDSLGTVNAHPAASQLGGAAIAPSFALVRQVRETALEKEIDPDEEMFFVVSPNFVTTLLDDPKATSFDYANAKALMSGGLVQGWMGFTWITSNRLTKPVVGPPAQVYGAAYTRDAVGLLVLDDVHAEVGKDPGAWFDTSIQLECDIGAVRIQDEKVLRVHYLETN
jgi:hypothetical protein